MENFILTEEEKAQLNDLLEKKKKSRETELQEFHNKLNALMEEYEVKITTQVLFA